MRRIEETIDCIAVAAIGYVFLDTLPTFARLTMALALVGLVMAYLAHLAGTCNRSEYEMKVFRKKKADQKLE